MIIAVSRIPNILPGLPSIFRNKQIVCCPIFNQGRIESEEYLDFGRNKVTSSLYKTGVTPAIILEMIEQKGRHTHFHYLEDLGDKLKLLMTATKCGDRQFVHVPVLYNKDKKALLSRSIWEAWNFATHAMDDETWLRDNCHLEAFWNLLKQYINVPTIDIKKDVGYRGRDYAAVLKDIVECHPTQARNLMSDYYLQTYGHSDTAYPRMSDVIDSTDFRQRVTWDDLKRYFHPKLKMKKNTHQDELGETFMMQETSSSKLLSLFKETIPTKEGTQGVIQNLKDFILDVLNFAYGCNDFCLRMQFDSAKKEMYITKGEYIERDAFGDYRFILDTDLLPEEMQVRLTEMLKAFVMYAEASWDIPLDQFRKISMFKVGMNIFFLAHLSTEDKDEGYRFGIPMTEIFDALSVFHYGDPTIALSKLQKDEKSS